MYSVSRVKYRTIYLTTLKDLVEIGQISDLNDVSFQQRFLGQSDSASLQGIGCVGPAIVRPCLAPLVLPSLALLGQSMALVQERKNMPIHEEKNRNIPSLLSNSPTIFEISLSIGPPKQELHTCGPRRMRK